MSDKPALLPNLKRYELDVWSEKSPFGGKLKGMSMREDATGRWCEYADIAPLVSDTQALVWQPIDSAPKTGRTLLLGYPNRIGNWRTVRGQWFSKELIEQDWEYGNENDEGWYETSVESDDIPNAWPINPTHWMPLPAPPANALGGEQP